MIIHSRGDLLTADVDALLNTVNIVGVMGEGIVLQIKRVNPANDAAYRSACASHRVQLGQMFVFGSVPLGPRRYVINFPTKARWRAGSMLTDSQAGLADLVRVGRERQIMSVAVPALGCGNRGLDGNEVRPAIERAFAELPEVRVQLFPPEGAPHPADVPVATAREMTRMGEMSS